MNRATHAAAVDMTAVAVLALGDKVGMNEVPLHNSLFDILMRQRKSKTATSYLTKLNATGYSAFAASGIRCASRSPK